jgi:hypothetical protein
LQIKSRPEEINGANILKEMKKIECHKRGFELHFKRNLEKIYLIKEFLTGGTDH